MLVRTDDRDTIARQSLLRQAERRLQEQGRRGLRKRPPRPRRPERQIRRYEAALREIVRAMERDIRDRVFPQIDSLLLEAGTRGDDVRADDWLQRLADLFAATRLALGPAQERATVGMNSIGDEVQGQASEGVIRQVRAVLGVSPDFFDQQRIADALNAWKAENGAFITRFAAEEVQAAQDAVSRAVRAGHSNRDIVAELRGRFGVSYNRARRIARTEVSQLNTQITRERHRELGITGYIWRTAMDERVRDQHADREGRHFEWNNPPEGGHPGEAVNCRCESQADLESLLSELEA